MFSLYEKVLKENYSKSGEILDILQVFFIQAMAGDSYKIETDQVIDFISDKLNIDISFEELRGVLEEIAVVDAVDDEFITLFNPEESGNMEDSMFPGEEENSNDVGEEIIDQESEEEKEQNELVKSATATAVNDLKQQELFQ